jgi:hypothetical protein
MYLLRVEVALSLEEHPVGKAVALWENICQHHLHHLSPWSHAHGPTGAHRHRKVFSFFASLSVNLSLRALFFYGKFHKAFL